MTFTLQVLSILLTSAKHFLGVACAFFLNIIQSLLTSAKHFLGVARALFLSIKSKVGHIIHHCFQKKCTIQCYVIN